MREARCPSPPLWDPGGVAALRSHLTSDETSYSDCPGPHAVSEQARPQKPSPVSQLLELGSPGPRPVQDREEGGLLPRV